MAKSYECFDCGAKFDKQYKYLLHADKHLGEPAIRPTACMRCVADLDVRIGYCTKCGFVQQTGWVVLTNEEAK